MHRKEYALTISEHPHEAMNVAIMCCEVMTDEDTPVILCTQAVHNATSVRMVADVSFFRDDGSECKSWRVLAQFRMIADVLTKVGQTLEQDIMGDAGCLPSVNVTASGTDIVIEAVGEVEKVLRAQLCGTLYFATPEGM